MKRTIKNIYQVVALSAILGLMGSTMHYHKEGIACLNHIHKEHYTQNSNLCPICTLVVSPDINVNLVSSVHLHFEGVLQLFDGIEYVSTTLLFEPGRAPPSMA